MLTFHYDDGVDLLEEIGKSIDRNARRTPRASLTRALKKSIKKLN